jgi:aminoglycoside phosphotransferase (APT) family kinase protein
MWKTGITPDLVRRLVAAQFPQWADLAVTPVELDGWDNTTFRLGPSMSVRLPSADVYVAQVDKEHTWLPTLAPLLPLPIPTPIARGRASPDFPRPWSVYAWIDGDVCTAGRVADRMMFAADVAAFLTELYACPAPGPPAGAHSFGRGGPVAQWHEQTVSALESVSGIDRDGARAVWDAALAAGHAQPDVWVHGDVTGSNLLVRNGELAGVIDFGCCAVGDPACDLVVAWTLFEGESRAAFRSLVAVEESAWARGRGWALWKALLHLASDARQPGAAAEADRRVGWWTTSRDLVRVLIEDLDHA